MSQKSKLSGKTLESNKDKSFSKPLKTSLSQARNPSVDNLLDLQKTAGNQAVQHLLESNIVQAKLSVFSVEDKYEKDADRIADQIMRPPGSRLQSKSTSDGGIDPPGWDKDIKEKNQVKISNDERTRDHEAESVEVSVTTNRAGTKNSEGGLDIEKQIQSQKSGGKPLPESARKFFESRFGYNFSPVRLHTNNKAASLARAMKAKAFTVGKNLFFNTGSYSPDTTQGKNLLAHELTHVIQQGHAEPLSQRNTFSVQSPQLKNDAGKESRQSEQGNQISAVHDKAQNIVQRSPDTEILLSGKPKPELIDVKPVGKNASEVSILGITIATVQNFSHGKLDLEISIEEVFAGPDKPPWVHIVLGCFPKHQIYLNESAKGSLSELGYNILIEVKLVGIEVTGDVESEIPHVPQRIPEPLIITPSKKEEPPVLPSPSEETEKPSPDEETAPKPSPEPPEPVITPEDKEKTEVERKQIKDLLNTAVNVMLLGGESESLVNEAAEKAANILKRKIAAFDPKAATEEMTQELIEAVADVMLLPGGDEAAIEEAMSKAKRWTEVELKRAVEKLSEAPSEAAGKEVLEKAGQVMLLGGDETAIEEAMSKLLSWAEAELKSAVEKLPKTQEEAVGKEVVGKEVLEKAARVMMLGGDATEAMDRFMAVFPPSVRKAPPGK